jgi:hypothetical protein
MTKTLLKWSIIIILAFSAGFIYRSYVNRSQKYDQGPVTGTTAFNTIAYKNDDQGQMSDEAKKNYHDLISEYFNYIRDEDNDKDTSFADFVSIRRSELVQQGKYSSEQEKREQQVLEWYNKLNEINTIPGYEMNTYNVSGTVLSTNKGQSLCSMGDRRYLNILVAAYLNQPTQDLYSVVPNNSLIPEQPLDYSIVECENGNFQLSFMLGNQIDKESPPVYFVAYVFLATTNSYLAPIAVGIDKKISGIPPSILSKRKKNQPITIKVQELKTATPYSEISITTPKGTMVMPYGLDGIASMMPEFSMFRTTISGADGVARLKPLPFSSNILIEMSYAKNTRSFFVVPTFSDLININVPAIKENKSNSLLVIPPTNMKEGEIIIFSKTDANKAAIKFNNQDRKPIFIDDLKPVETFLELRSKDYKSLGLMPVKIREEALSIVEPSPRHIEKIVGKIYLINSLSENNIPCKGCSISVKYTDRTSSSDENGSFVINDISIIDNLAQIEIDSGSTNIAYPIIVHRPMRTLRLDIVAPSKNLLRAWNQSVPTMPGYGVVFGSHPKRSFHAFLIGLDFPYSAEAYYFADQDNSPSKKLFATPYEPSDTGFGKFIFPNMKPGDYVLYLLTNEKILHTRVISVNAGKITLIN